MITTDPYVLIDNLNKVTLELEKIGVTTRIKFDPSVHPRNLVIDGKDKCSYAFLQLQDRLEIQLIEGGGIKISVIRKEEKLTC